MLRGRRCNIPVWQTPVYAIWIRTSLARGGRTSMSSMERGFPASQATAALHLIICALCKRYEVEGFRLGKLYLSFSRHCDDVEMMEVESL